MKIALDYEVYWPTIGPRYAGAFRFLFTADYLNRTPEKIKEIGVQISTILIDIMRMERDVEGSS